jgi:hypothetical protein
VQSASLWLAIATVMTTLAVTGPVSSRAATPSASPMMILRRADSTMTETRSLHRLMGRMRPRRFYALDTSHPGQAYAVWSSRLKRARKAVRRPPHLRDWLCIHRYEGAWNDGGAPYYGGLQMDWGFMHAYGGRLLARRGTADRWTPLQQMWVAERALRAGRGFYPWPNTARTCGLI